ncbi:MAG TPA: GAF domain-containing protein, partial [Sandaracinaceae bacterium LLY-WYZ-13_1]|nr:GAF domain-containing protein [Sandaracinaceae bacterium LLY-WYZ-13_1]
EAAPGQTEAPDPAAPSQPAPDRPSETAPGQPAPSGAAAQAAPSQPAPSPAGDDLDLAISDEVVDSTSTPAGGTSDDRLATAFEALQDLFFLTTPIEGVDFVLKLLADLVPSEASSACLYDINTDELRFVALVGPGSDERKGEGVPRLSGLLGAAALDPGTVVLVDAVETDDRYDPGVDGRVGLEPRTMALVGVSYQGRLMGLLQLINRADESIFTRPDANLLAYVAEKLGEFLQSARMRPDEQHVR